MPAYTIVYADAEDLHNSPSQPLSRLTMDASINSLKKSIQDVGLQYPPLVTRQPDGNGFTIVDGHRRIKAMKTGLSWEKIPVLVAQGDPGRLFAAVSGTTKKLTAGQWIEVYLAGGDVPSGPTKSCIRRLEETVGREFLIELVKAGLSPQIWSLANRFISYTKLDQERKIEVLRWLLRHRITRQAAAWISGSNPAAELVSAFEENRALA